MYEQQHSFIYLLIQQIFNKYLYEDILLGIMGYHNE